MCAVPTFSTEHPAAVMLILQFRTFVQSLASKVALEVAPESITQWRMLPSPESDRTSAKGSSLSLSFCLLSESLESRAVGGLTVEAAARLDILLRHSAARWPFLEQ